jgi:hypothetical protein
MTFTTIASYQRGDEQPAPDQTHHRMNEQLEPRHNAVVPCGQSTSTVHAATHGARTDITGFSTSKVPGGLDAPNTGINY